MAKKSLAGGELYLIGEKDPKSGSDTPFVKIGIVRDNENRSTETRLLDHQTGNPRKLHVLQVIHTPVVERVETTLHGLYATQRLSGEWFTFSPKERRDVVARATQFASEAKSAQAAMQKAADLKKVESTDAVRKPSKKARELHSEYLRLNVQDRACADVLKLLIQALSAARDAGVKTDGVMSVQSRRPSERFDEEAFKAEYPTLWAKFSAAQDKWSTRFTWSVSKNDLPELKSVNKSLATFVDSVSQLVGDPKQRRSVDKFHGKYLEALQFVAPVDWALELVADRVRAECGAAAGIDGICTWSRTATREKTLDKGALREHSPDVYGKFVKLTQSKPAIVVNRDLGFRL